jgi:hypothetical protein
MFIIGATLVALVLLLPEGVAGGFARLVKKMTGRSAAGVA